MCMYCFHVHTGMHMYICVCMLRCICILKYRLIMNVVLPIILCMYIVFPNVRILVSISMYLSHKNKPSICKVLDLNTVFAVSKLGSISELLPSIYIYIFTFKPKRLPFLLLTVPVWWLGVCFFDHVSSWTPNNRSSPPDSTPSLSSSYPQTPLESALHLHHLYRTLSPSTKEKQN